MPTPESSVSVEVKSIAQKALKSERSFENEFSEGKAVVSIKVEEVEDAPYDRDLFCRVRFRSEDDLPIFEVESIIRVQFDVETKGTPDIDALSDTLSEVGLRVSYPYQRHAVSSAVIQSGLPGFMLPLAADSDWAEVVRQSKQPTEGGEDDGDDAP